MINIENIRRGRKPKSKHIILTVHNPHLLILHLRVVSKLWDFPQFFALPFLSFSAQKKKRCSFNNVAGCRRCLVRIYGGKNMFPSLFAILQQFYWDIFLVCLITLTKSSRMTTRGTRNISTNCFNSGAQHFHGKRGTFQPVRWKLFHLISSSRALHSSSAGFASTVNRKSYQSNGSERKSTQKETLQRR